MNAIKNNSPFTTFISILFLCCILFFTFIGSGQGHAHSAYAYQAYILQDAGVDLYWYPEQEEEIVLAIDTDLCRENITGWQDFYTGNAVLGLDTDRADYPYGLIAFTQGITGTIKTNDTISILRHLRDTNRLRIVDNSTEYAQGTIYPTNGCFPVEFMFKSRALAEQAAGRNLNLIAPAEGTFTVTKGEMTQTRLPDMQPSIPTTALTDPNGVNTYVSSIGTTIRRNVIGIRQWTSANSYEHFACYFILLICIILTFSYIQQRTVLTRLKRALTGLEISMLLFSILRILKLCIDSADIILSRYVWYAFYPCFFGISLACLLIAYYTGAPTEGKRTPFWWKFLCRLDIGCVFLVFTNDWHGLFVKTIADPLNNAIFYIPGIMNTPVKLLIAGQFIAVLVLLLKNTAKGKRISAKFFLPVFILVLELFFHACYNLDLWGAKNMETILVTNIGILLFVITAVYAGILPTNKGYKTAFYYSTVSMEIQNKDGHPFYKSVSNIPHDDNMRLHIRQLQSGKLLWQEDISEINRIRHSLSLNKTALERSTHLLKKQKQLRHHLIELNARDKIFKELEKIISFKQEKIRRLATLLQDKHITGDCRRHHINLLSCLVIFIKKRSLLLLNTREKDILKTAELIAALRESCSYFQKAGLNTACMYGMTTDTLPAQEALFAYDLAELIWEESVKTTGSDLLLGFYNECSHLQVIIRAEADLKDALDRAIKTISIKALYDNAILRWEITDTDITLTLTFPKEEQR